MAESIHQRRHQDGSMFSISHGNRKTQRCLWILALAIIVAQQCMIQWNGICWSLSPGPWTRIDSHAPLANVSSSAELDDPRMTTHFARPVVLADNSPPWSSSSFQQEDENENEQQQQQRSNAQDFERQEGVAIVSKLHGSQKDINQLIQALCLLKVAYNRRMKYDHVVFSSLPIISTEQDRLIEIVHPAKISFYNDTKPLEEALEDMTPSQKIQLAESCGVPSYRNITWQTYCQEKCGGGGEECYPKCQLRYLWQAEFRSKHLWSHEALKPYRYMMWFDSDTFPMRVWKQDPIATMVRNNLVLLFDNFPMGGDGGAETHRRIRDTFGRTICGIALGDHGEFITTPTNENGVCVTKNLNQYPQVKKIHGFFHVTDLRFYRSEIALKWYDNMIGDSKYARKWDDQLSVTIPAAMLAPNRSWDMRTNGVVLNVMHNGRLDGRPGWNSGWYMPFWKNKTNFPEARRACSRVVKNGGR